MQEWINQVLQSPNFHAAILPASFLLGVLGALNPCCTGPLLGAVAGYSGSLSQRGGRRAIVLAGLFFMLGTFLALAVVGAATGFVSQLAESSLGSYWKMFAGLVLVFFGLACLKLVPINMPKLSSQKRTEPAGLIEATVFGLLVGGSTTLCSAACNPTLAVALGVATLQGQTLQGAVVLAVYGLGYSLPLAAAIIGLGLGVGKLTSLVTRLAPIVQNAAGVILLAVGFILLARI
jgi:cytochrome c biogenesis protein CcdA